MTKTKALQAALDEAKTEIVDLKAKLQRSQVAIQAVVGQRNAAMDQVASLQADLAIARSAKG